MKTTALSLCLMSALNPPPRAAPRAVAPAPQLKVVTFDDVYDPEKKVEWSGSPASVTWIGDRHYLVTRTDARKKTNQLLKVETQSGTSEPLFDAARMEQALSGLEGISTLEAAAAARLASYTTNQDATSLLLNLSGDLYSYDVAAASATRLTRAEGREEQGTFSPDGKRVAFVRGGNLVALDLATRTEKALTADGSSDVLNGKLDWVYQEEIYGRGNFRGYWWSPDSTRIAFLRLDEKRVPRYTLVDDIPYRPEVERYHYPKAGDPNPEVRLGIADVASGKVTWVDPGPSATAEPLIVEVAWHPDGRQVVYQVQDREQTWLDLDLAEAETGRTRRLLRNATSTWIQPHGSPRWLKDGGFLLVSEHSGFAHLYRYASDGTLLYQVTRGNWDVRKLHGIDEKGGWVYFSATERSSLGLDVYRTNISGDELVRLSPAPGTHEASFNDSLGAFIDKWSDAATPAQIRLHGADGKEIRVIDANPVAALGEYRLAKPEFFQIKTRDGADMEAALLKPHDFDPRKRYPVYQHTYAGPESPQVRNAWSATNFMFFQLLVEKGVVVFVCDNRTASAKGVGSSWPAYQRLGASELADIEDGVAWLKQQRWVDPARIGLGGWSYGGFMTSYALTHSRSFAMGIAGGSVTDWRDYDSVYTERYMRTPQNNPDGYRDTAPRLAAAELHGKLLLIHGAIDDNVHPQNTMQFAYELQKAAKPFRMMLYPKSKHGVTDPALVRHMRLTMLHFIEETLLRPAEGASPR